MDHSKQRQDRIHRKTIVQANITARQSGKIPQENQEVKNLSNNQPALNTNVSTQNLREVEVEVNSIQ